MGTVFGVWFGFLSFGKWLRYRFKKKVEPNILIDFIISHESWNHFEFAKLLKISPNNAKNLLRGFGYKWNKNTQLYCKRVFSCPCTLRVQEQNNTPNRQNTNFLFYKCN